MALRIKHCSLRKFCRTVFKSQITIQQTKSCHHHVPNLLKSSLSSSCNCKRNISDNLLVLASVHHYSTVTAKRHETAPNKPFKVLQTEGEVDTSTEEFRQNKERYAKYVKELRQAEAIARAGGGEKSIERHVKRHGKLMITDRVKGLVDDVDDFLELSLTAGLEMDYGHVPRASTLTGIGKIQGRYCIVIANDGAFKGGAVYPITLKKNLRAQEIAAQNRLPCVYLVDSAGAFLPLQAQIFNEGGKSFYNEAVLGAAKIPQVAIVCGSCTAGGAYVPTMADEAVIVNKTGTIFLAGPPLVQAALGEIVSAEELGGATVHCGTSGCTDYFAENEAEALEMGRDIVSALNVSCNEEKDYYDYDEPLFDADDIPGLVPPPNLQHEMNMYQIVARIVDGSRFHEFKAMFGSCLLTGFAHIHGHLVGIIANKNGIIGEAEANKATHFVSSCSERNIPLVFLQNTADKPMGARAVDKEGVLQQDLTIKSQGTLMAALSCANIPKLTVIVGNGYGSSHYLMGGQAISPNFIFAWPNARVAEMNPQDLAKSVAQEACLEGEEAYNKLVEKLTKQSSALYCSTHLQNDGVILPQDTRKVLSQCLSICKAYKQPDETNYPILRM